MRFFQSTAEEVDLQQRIVSAVLKRKDFAHQCKAVPLVTMRSDFRTESLQLGNGLVLPSAIAGAISIRPDIVGAASGFVGSMQVGSGAAISAISGANPE